MAGEDGRGGRSRQTVAVILVLCSLAPTLTCFSLRRLSENIKQDEVVSEATVMKARTGRIVFSGKELDSQSGSASAAATGNDIDLDQSDDTEMLEQTSQLEDAMANEEAWRRLNPSLHCGQNKMRLKAVGPRAADLQLDMGNAEPLPLIQVPETCSYSMKQNAKGLVLVVPYDGCNVIQENGSYVLPMKWLETPVNFTCPVLTSSPPSPALTTPEPAHNPWKLPFPHGPWSLNRHKRHVTEPLSIYDPRSPYYSYMYYYYYMYMMGLTPAPSTAPTTTATTTAKPDTTAITTKPSTEKPSEKPPEKPPAYPPAYPPYPYYQYYPYYPYYPYYYPLPVKTTAPPATTSTNPTTTSRMTEMTTTASASTTTASASTTTSVSTTKTHQITQKPHHPPYIPYPYYHPGQPFPGIPDNSEVYFYPVIQHYYGNPPYPQNPITPMPTTRPPTLTTAKPGETAPTDKPSGSSTTKKTTPAPTTQPTKAPDTTKPSSNVYPGPLSPYVPYYQLPFVPYVSYKYNKAGRLPDDQKFMPQAAYKSGFQPRAHPPPHSGFHYWQPVPWFPHSTGQDNPDFDWNNLQLKRA